VNKPQCDICNAYGSECFLCGLLKTNITTPTMPLVPLNSTITETVTQPVVTESVVETTTITNNPVNLTEDRRTLQNFFPDLNANATVFTPPTQPVQTKQFVPFQMQNVKPNVKPNGKMSKWRREPFTRFNKAKYLGEVASNADTEITVISNEEV
jgi:hypothetical protein